MQYNGQTYTAWGLGAHPLYDYRLSAGHWFTTADTATGARPAVSPVVLGPAVARVTGARVGQILTFTLAAGPTRVRVIGIDTGQTNAGGTVYIPLPVLERLDGGLAQLAFTPLLAGWSIWVGVAISTRASEVRVAQPLGLLANLPSVAVTTVIAFNVIPATLVVALGAAVVLLVLNRLGWRVTSAMFDRERLITCTR